MNKRKKGNHREKDSSETPQNKKKNSVSAQESTKPDQLQSTNNVPSHETPVTPAPPVAPVTPVPPITPATQKGKGKTSTPKTPSVVTSNPNDY